MAGLVVAIQASALLVLTIAELWAIDSRRVGLGVSTAVFFGAFGLLLLAAAAQILRGRSWARGFLVFSQLLAVVLSFNFRDDAWWLPLGLGGSAVLALGCLLSRPVSAALNDHPGGDRPEANGDS